MSLLKSLYEKDLYPELDEAGETSYGRDCLALAAERMAKGEIDRRTFLRCAAMLGALPLVGKIGAAEAAAREVVIVNWGGNSIPAYTKAFGEAFEKQSGIKVALDGTGPLPAKIRAMVQSGKVVWDLIDFDASKAVVLDAEGLLQPIDYSIVDKNKVYPGWAYKAGVAFYIYSSVLTFDTAKLKEEKPNSWKDFWDVKKFPGQRALRKTPEGGIEACMMAAGRSPKDVYPIDIDLAVSKVKELKSNLITWNTGSQSQDVLRNGEVVMAQLWHSRAATLFKEFEGQVPVDLEPGPDERRRLVGAEEQPGRYRDRDEAHRLHPGPAAPGRPADHPWQRAGQPGRRGTGAGGHQEVRSDAAGASRRAGVAEPRLVERAERPRQPVERCAGAREMARRGVLLTPGA